MEILVVAVSVMFLVVFVVLYFVVSPLVSPRTPEPGAAQSLREVYARVGEDPKVGDRAIKEIMAGPHAEKRLRATERAVRRRYRLEE